MDIDKSQSATVKVKTKNNFEWLFSIRAETTKDLVAKMETMEDIWMEAGWSPLAQNAQKFPKKEIEYVEGRVCPTCGEKLVYATKKDGTRFIKCSTNKYINGQATGCSFVDWGTNK